MDHHNAGEAFIELLAAINTQGAVHQSRAGSTRELLHQSVTLTRPLERCVVVPHRNNDVFAAIAETIWVIAGRADMEFLTRYVRRAPEFSDDGVQWRAGYGPRMRRWGGATDQLAGVVAELRNNPESRRAVISLFDPTTDLLPTKDVPCTDWLQFVLRDGVLSLAVTVRSNDLFWGFSGINTFEWSVLHEMVATWLGASVGAVTFFIGSLHVYERHFDRAERILASRPGPELYPVPAAPRFSTPLEDLDAELDRWFDVEKRVAASDLSDVDTVRDPLLRDFAWMLAADAAGKRGDLPAAASALEHVADTALVAAARDTLRWRDGLIADEQEGPTGDTLPEDLSVYLMSLHREKTAGYGDSWKKRGEVFGVLPNIDRKIDRLVVLDSQPAVTTESLLDTAVDLFVYAVKYKTLLLDLDGSTLRGGTWSDDVDGFEALVPEIVASDVTPTPTVAEVAALVTAIEEAMAARADRAERIALAEKLIAGTWSLLLETARRNEGATYREFARQKRSERKRLGAPSAVLGD
ncbi:thymidylate synthase [Curtobacterium sp. PhB136]|uniref:thymidylate synthase n=1 Tax=Curtobacterium sp. PhB136 TaxID=2485181 RepID=UPI0010DFD101|nr:thymidylate synthase [Curtobacterium sp. PhB136]TCK65837.1 thymidylate synthase [Curtobacterium sp. PhB136]